MPAALSCPSSDRLRELALGFVSAGEIAALERHVLECSACASALEKLADGDSLAAALRGVGSAEVPQECDVKGVIERACQLGDTLPAHGPNDTTESVHETARPQTGAPVEVARLTAQILAPPQAPGEIGRLGPYRVLELLGHGGMGFIFLAEDEQLHRRVALKAMQPRLADSADAQARFKREARAAAALKHDHIVTIYHVGEDRGIFWLAMELLVGEPLDRRLKREGTLGLLDTLRMGRQVAEGLAAAHARGLVHRDIKPGNIWLESSRPRAKVLDFGLARAAEDDSHLTHLGDIVGTPAYMSPEQARGEAADHRSDLFSLGCVLYRCVTGKTAFSGRSTMATLYALANSTPPSIRTLVPDVPASLETLITHLLQKNPAARPQSAGEVIAALEALELEQRAAPPPLAPPVCHIPTLNTASSVNRSRRSPWIALYSTLAVLLGGLLLAAIWLQVRTPAGTIVVEVDQPELIGAEVTVDGRQRLTIKSADSKEPIQVVADDKKHTLKVVKGGFETYTRQFTVRAGKQQVIQVRLEPQRVTPGSNDIEKATPTRMQPVASTGPLANDPNRALVPWLQERGVVIRVAQKTDTGEYFDLPKDSQPPLAPFVLRKLEIVNESRITADEVGRLAELPFLNEFSVSGSSLGADAVPQLARLSYVKQLYLGTANLRSSSLSELRRMPFLFGLHVNGNLMDDDGASLCNFPALRDLLIAGSQPVKLARLAEIPGLRSIRLSGSTANLSEVAQLQETNPKCRVIIRSGGPFKTLGRDPVREAANGLLAHGVRLRGGAMGQPTDQALTLAMLAEDRPYVVKEMTVPAHVKLLPEDLDLLPCLFGALDNIDASGTSGADELAAALGSNQVYWSIIFAKSDLTDAGLKHLQRIGGLEVLNVRESRVTRRAVEQFHTAVPRCLLTSSFGVYKAIPPSALGNESAQSLRGNFALEFNGQDSYVALPTLLYDGTHPITLEATVVPYETQVRGDVIGNSISTGMLLKFPGPNNPGHGVFTVKDSAGYQNIPTLEAYTPNSPLHVAALLQGSSVRLYLNGKLQGSSELSGSYEPGNFPFLVGATPGIDLAPMKSPFRGVIDELRVSKSARYSVDFTPPKRFEPDKETLALYHFDEGQGKTLTDSSGNAHHGTIFNATWVSFSENVPLAVQTTAESASASSPPSTTATALDFSTRLGQTPTHVQLGRITVGDPLTVELYATSRSVEQRRVPLWKHDGIYCLYLNQEWKRWNWVWFDFALSKGGRITGPPVTVGKRTHLAGVSTGSDLLFFVDGKLQGQQRITSELRKDRVTTTFGAHWTDHDPWDGTIDEARVSKIARYQTDFIPPPSDFEADHDTIALYHFDEGQGSVLKDSSGKGQDGMIFNPKWVPRVLADLSPAKKPEQQPQMPPRIGQWVSLFNGQDLTNWEMRSDSQPWVVQDGQIVADGTIGAVNIMLRTLRSDFTNFHLRIEAMTTTEQSWITVRVPDEGINFYRVRLRDGELTARVSASGDLAGLMPGDPDNGTKFGEWFTQEVIANDDKLAILVNGKQVGVFSDKERRTLKGAIGFTRRRDTTVRIRKIEIKELPP